MSNSSTMFALSARIMPPEGGPDGPPHNLLIAARGPSESYPKISIVTPSYNQGMFLEQTILSVLDQDYPNLEYIIIDGGSTDNSVEIIKKYEHQLAYWVSEPDRGQSHALNKGFQKVTGDIVGWINSDDVYFSSDVFKKVAIWFQEHPEFDACYGHNIYVGANGQLLFCRKAFPVFHKGLLRVWNFINQPTVFFRSQVLDTCQVSERYQFCMDYDFWLEMAETYQFGCFNILAAAARWHSMCKTVSGPIEDLQATKAILHARGLPARHVRVSRKLAYFLLRIYSSTMLLNIRDMQSRAMFDLKISNRRRIWTRQLLGLSVDRRLWGMGDECA